jgi:hypothetical protein
MAQVSTLEQTVLESLRKLPTERQQQVLDFVRFLEVQDDSISEPSKEDGDAKWEKLFASEKSELALEKLAKQALADIEAGLGRPMIFTGDDIKPG